MNLKCSTAVTPLYNRGKGGMEILAGNTYIRFRTTNVRLIVHDVVQKFKFLSAQWIEE